MIHPQEFRAITSYIRDRNLGLLSDPVYKGGEGKGLDSEELSIFGGVGVIQIEGPITYKPVEMLCAPEGTSYLKLIDQVEEMVEAGVKAIVFGALLVVVKLAGCLIHQITSETLLQKLA